MTELSRPMLAGKYDPEKANFPMWGSYKIDGVRCLVRGGVALSRSMKPLPNKHIQAWAKCFAEALEGVDGEIVVGDPTSESACRETVSAVMSIEGEPDFSFIAFDLWDSSDTYAMREEMLDEMKLCAPGFVVLDNFLIESDHDAMAFLAEAEDLGYEGIMLRNPGAFYKQGRASTKTQELLKVKSFSDTEAEVVAVHELMHNGNEAEVSEIGLTKRSHKKEGMVGRGTLGSLEVRNEELWPGLTFHIGTGFNAGQRDLLWDTRDQLVGSLVKFKYFPTGSKERPRFPVFICFRPEEDM